jgi:hypothetical protein
VEHSTNSDESKRASRQVLLGLGMLIIIFGLFNDRNILTVTLLYFAIISEGTLAGFYLFGRETIFEGYFTKKRDNDYKREEREESNLKAISPIATFLRSANRGSEFSRHEIARILSHLAFERTSELGFQKTRKLNSRVLELFNNDAQFREDFQDVVYAYLPGEKSERKQPNTTTYSQSLARLVTKLANYEKVRAF